MVMFIFSVGAWVFLGWKVGLALAAGVLLECIEAMVLLRAVSRLKRENADLVSVLNGVASDLERAVEEADSCVDSDSQMAKERQP
jgi:hypothetical protein